MKILSIFLSLFLFTACKKEKAKETLPTVYGNWAMENEPNRFFNVTSDSCSITIKFSEPVDAPPGKIGAYKYELNQSGDTITCVGEGSAPIFKFWIEKNSYTGVVAEWKQSSDLGVYKKLIKSAE